MRTTKWIAISLIALTFSCLGASRASAEDGDGTKLRWDIFQLKDITATSATIAARYIAAPRHLFRGDLPRQPLV